MFDLTFLLGKYKSGKVAHIGFEGARKGLRGSRALFGDNLMVAHMAVKEPAEVPIVKYIDACVVASWDRENSDQDHLV